MISIGEVLQALEPSQGRAAPTGSGVKTLPEQLQASAKAFAEIALVLIGLSYLAGFLVTYTFQSRLGIHDANAEFLRIRYIHTGLLCLAFPMFIAVPLTAHLWMLKKQRQHPDLYKLARRKNFIVGKSHLPYTVQLLCVSLCLFVYVLFEPYGEFHAHLWFVTGLLVLLLGQLVIGRKYVGFAAKKEHPVLRGLLAAGSCLVLFFALKGTILYLCLIFSKAASYWLFIASLDFYLFNTLDSKLVFWYPGQKQGVYLARWALVMTLSILSVLTFAYRVYPYIRPIKVAAIFTLVATPKYACWPTEYCHKMCKI